MYNVMKNEHFSQKFKCVTLIEVILDAAILSALATIVIMSLLTSLRTVTHSSVVSTAAQLANEQIETLRNYRTGRSFRQGTSWISKP